MPSSVRTPVAEGASIEPLPRLRRSSAHALPGRSTARHVALVYLLLAAAWILLSDTALDRVFSDAHALAVASTVKGWLFVLVTSALLYVALRNHHARLAGFVDSAGESEARYRAVFEGTPRPILVQDEETGAILAVNAAACAEYGYTEDELRRLRLSDLTVEYASKEGRTSPTRSTLSDGASRRARHRRSDGSEFAVEIVGARIRFGGRDATLTFVQDLTARIRDEEHMKASALAFENVAEAIAVLDVRGRIVSINQAFERLTGFPQDEVLGRSARILVHGSPRLVRQAVTSTGRADGEMWLKRRQARPFLVALSVRALHDDTGAVTHYVAVARDMSAEKEAEARIHALAYYDTLTGLPNRNLLEDRVRQVVALHERQHETFALLMVDLDHFKQVNDTLGHVAGDALLQTAARRIDAAVREADTAARWGGDEFVLLLPGTDGEGAGTIAQRIQKAMAAPVTIEGRLVALGVSIGISLFPKDGHDFEALLKKAGTAMQRAKDIGRNTFQFHEDVPQGEARERVAIAGALRLALDGGPQMQVFYQPQLELKSGRVKGFEALVRWRHPELGEVPPQKFIRIAETSGYMGSLGIWVLREACVQLRTLHAAGLPDATVSVNVSVTQLHDPRFAQRCLAILQEAGIRPEQLDLEVTETVLLHDHASVLSQLAELRALGVGISIDDFGTGYSSLSYLRHLPINKIKIDRSFVHDMLSDTDAASIVGVIVGLAHTLHHTVVAEGVENEAQEHALSDLDCDQAQGFLFGPPMSPPGLYDWLEQRHELPRVH